GDRGRDRDRVDRGVGEQVAVVAVGGDPRIAGRGEREPRRVELADRGQLRPVDLGEVPDEVRAPVAVADDADSDLVLAPDGPPDHQASLEPPREHGPGVAGLDLRLEVQLALERQVAAERMPRRDRAGPPEDPEQLPGRHAEAGDVPLVANAVDPRVVAAPAVDRLEDVAPAVRTELGRDRDDVTPMVT